MKLRRFLNICMTKLELSKPSIQPWEPRTELYRRRSTTFGTKQQRETELTIFYWSSGSKPKKFYSANRDHRIPLWYGQSVRSQKFKISVKKKCTFASLLENGQLAKWDKEHTTSKNNKKICIEETIWRFYSSYMVIPVVFYGDPGMTEQKLICAHGVTIMYGWGTILWAQTTTLCTWTTALCAQNRKCAQSSWSCARSSRGFLQVTWKRKSNTPFFQIWKRHNGRDWILF